MALPDLRNDAERVLKATFPNSIYFRGGPQASSPWWKVW
jgi:outer membrane protein assembly factor BamD